MAICDVVVEIDGLAGVFLHEPFVDIRSVLGVDVEARPSDPSEAHRLFATREGGHEPTRGHLEVVFALSILGNGNWKTVGDYYEMLSACGVLEMGEAGVGGGGWNGHGETVLGGEWRSLWVWEDFQRRSVIYLAYSPDADPDYEDSSDISPFPYPVFHSKLLQTQANRGFRPRVIFPVRVKFFFRANV